MKTRQTDRPTEGGEPPPHNDGVGKKKRRRKMIVFVIILFHILGVISSIHAIMSTRTAQGAIAWAVSLNTFPYVAVPAYWVLGRSRFQGYTTARQAKLQEIDSVTDEAAKQLLQGM
jgi:cardiolipin synthase A/B